MTDARYGRISRWWKEMDYIATKLPPDVQIDRDALLARDLAKLEESIVWKALRAYPAPERADRLAGMYDEKSLHWSAVVDLQEMFSDRYPFGDTQ